MDKVIEGIIILVIIICGAYIINLFDNKNKKRSAISIKESLDLARMPVITFKEGNTKLNFLIDTGSSESHICTSAANKLTGTPIDVQYEYIGSTGTSDSASKAIEANLKYKKDEFKINLFINDNLDSSFIEVKKECGVVLHGILGSDFLEKYKYIIDFSELVIYHK